jgi:hypothetical protein
VRDAPEVAAWAAEAKKLCETWHDIIFERLNPTGTPPGRTVTIVFKGPSMRGIAYTHAPESTITMSAAWVKKHPDDLGMVIHELTHVVQNYPRSKSSNPFWVVEGIADYVRYYEFEPERRTPIDWNKTYRDGYGIASALLDWIERTRDPHLMEKLNARLALGEYTDGLFADCTGVPLAQLWEEFLAAQRPKRAEGKPRRFSGEREKRIPAQREATLTSRSTWFNSPSAPRGGGCNRRLSPHPHPGTEHARAARRWHRWSCGLRFAAVEVARTTAKPAACDQQEAPAILSSHSSPATAARRAA